MNATSLFENIPFSEEAQPLPEAEKVTQNFPPRKIRINEPVRNQVEMVCRALNDTLPEDHPSRVIWAFLEKMDLSLFYKKIEVYTDSPGRPATTPKVLLALWLYATAEGIGSARHLAELCQSHDAYRWICGGVPINYHMLSDFRIENKEALNTLMTDILTAMMSEELVTLKRVAQDGMRVRASAGAASFRREGALIRMREEVALHVLQLSSEVNAAEETKREKSARERAVRERQERIASAIAQLPKLRAVRNTEVEKGEVRVSTTDFEARVMKMADGGFRPAFNVQLATDTESQVVVGVSVVANGSDANEAVPMVTQIMERTKKVPEEYLIDGGFTKKATIENLANQMTVYGPVKKSKDGKRDVHQPLARDSEAVAAWRIRMGSAEAKEIYKDRAATAECVNAKFRSMYGMQQFRVRGIDKVTSVALLTAITHNLFRWIGLTG